MALAIGYLRVSTEEQALSTAGIDAQRARIVDEAARREWDLDLIQDAGFSAKDLDRPGLQAALARLANRRDPASILVVAKLDRLSRSIIDSASLLERSRREDWSLVALDIGVDTSTATGEMVANMTATVAQFERRAIGERTSVALRARQARGIRVGRPVSLPGEVRDRIAAMRADELSLQAIARSLTEDGTPTARGGARWYPSTVAAVLRSISHENDLRAARTQGA